VGPLSCISFSLRAGHAASTPPVAVALSVADSKACNRSRVRFANWTEVFLATLTVWEVRGMRAEGTDDTLQP